MGSDHSTAEGARRDAHKKERDFFVCVGYPTCQSRLAMWPAGKG